MSVSKNSFIRLNKYVCACERSNWQSFIARRRICLLLIKDACEGLLALSRCLRLLEISSCEPIDIFLFKRDMKYFNEVLYNVLEKLRRKALLIELFPGVF